MAVLRVHLFSIGDPQNINTWSNVPYFFFQALEKKGVKVLGFNVIPEKRLSYRIARFLVSLWRRFAGSSHDEPTFFRNRLIHWLARRNLQRLSRRYPEADVNLFFTFTFSSYRSSRTPVVYYCDRTYEHYLEERGRKVTARDRRFIETERVNLERAALVLTLNQPCCDFVRTHYRPDSVHRLKAGINLETLGVGDPVRLIAIKERWKNILFIGRNAEMRGVDILISAFRIFTAENGNDFKLHIVGVTREELRDCWHEKIELYPYLRKDDPRDLSIYKELLETSRLFVVPMRRGPLPGVIREAHWACTPVIISNVSNASERVSHEQNGILVDSLKPEDFAYQMTRLIRDGKRWREMAMEAHLSVSQNTWDATASEFLHILTEREST
jgi:glycosyltransferase involved in cell wall biosynthesis